MSPRGVYISKQLHLIEGLRYISPFIKTIFCGGLKIVVELNESAYRSGIFNKLAVDLESLSMLLKINFDNKVYIMIH